MTEGGITQTRYNELEVVQLWRGFLDEPDSFLRHLFADD
jgi:predicted ATPase